MGKLFDLLATGYDAIKANDPYATSKPKLYFIIMSIKCEKALRFVSFYYMILYGRTILMITRNAIFHTWPL